MAKVLVTDTNLENIADAIRTKTGGSDTYKPSQMASAINNISTKLVLPSSGIAFGNSGSSALNTVFPNIDTSQVVRFDNFFKIGSISSSSFNSVPLFDTSNGKYFYSMFYNQSYLTEIPEYNTSKGEDFRCMFQNCSRLETIPILDLSKATYMGDMFKSCQALSNTSLNNILYMLANATSYAGTKTLAEVGLSSEQATTCTGLSNYSAFTTAGWSTGY